MLVLNSWWIVALVLLAFAIGAGSVCLFYYLRYEIPNFIDWIREKLSGTE